MRSFAILLRKEEMALFSSPIAYAVMTVFLLVMGYSFTLTLFISHQPSLRSVGSAQTRSALPSPLMSPAPNKW